ncbi:ImuA family protein [Pararhodospirillum oryzae]|uniref:Damage-inducible mutagenesis protein n=1 Tax=Pararhodospirillum oryzae TaxID=478448 RepID=A0A512H998_9PROT|nr:damage-inducible protein [Pararhodospirillum oryzae]GEO82025.1 hypothetical protein ROR02_21560 [Pararhodospirillum oryzae]
MPQDADLAALRRVVRQLEEGGRETARVCPLGIAAVDAALPGGGLALGQLHQVVAGPGAFEGPATAFAAWMAARLARGRGPVVWCVQGGEDDTLYAPGLAALGLEPGRLMVARARDPARLLWSLEEALHCPEVGAVIGQGARLEGTSGRRLHLAAARRGVPGVLLERARRGGAPGVASTRWRLEGLPSAPTPWGGPGPARWRVVLERCRGGVPRAWILEWCDEAGTLDLVADADHRSPDPARATGGSVA